MNANLTLFDPFPFVVFLMDSLGPVKAIARFTTEANAALYIKWLKDHGGSSQTFKIAMVETQIQML